MGRILSGAPGDGVPDDDLPSEEAVIQKAAQAFGTKVRAHSWLNHPSEGLGGIPPAELMGTPEGRTLLIGYLDCIGQGHDQGEGEEC